MPVEHAIARIYNASGAVMGTGFLVDDAHIMTCAHVVNAALRRPYDAADQPTDPISIDFPLLPGGASARIEAKVTTWKPMGAGDIAVLELQEARPDGAPPVSFGSTTGDMWGKECRTFGFRVPSGQPATGRTLTRQADGWLTVEADPATQYFVEPGFSGAPAWDTAGRVLGMVTTRDSDKHVRVAFIIPAETLFRAYLFLTNRS